MNATLFCYVNKNSGLRKNLICMVNNIQQKDHK
jgi:hypothetical protein